MRPASTAALCLLAAALGHGCLWRPTLTAVDGQRATEFRDLLTGGGGSRPFPAPAGAAGVRVTYLGTSGFLVERGDDAVLLAPFFSHHGYGRLALWKVSSDRQLIDERLRPLAPRLARVSAVLVGHGHYDHLLDVPHVVRTWCPQAKVYGNRSVVNALHGERGLQVAAPVDAVAERPPGGTGDWLPGRPGRVRFMAIASGHAPNVAGVTVATGDVEAPLATPPRKAGGLRLGQAMAYTIDFLEPSLPDPIAFRIYYQDSAEPPAPHHLVTRPGQPGRRIDLAIVCVAAFEGVAGDDYPERLQQVLQPRRFLLSHWESFFRPWTDRVDELRAVPRTEPRRFVRRLEAVLPADAAWVMPTPGTSLVF